MRTLAERRHVEKLLARGASDYAIAGITGVPRSTVGNWRRHPERGPREVEPAPPWRPPDAAAYPYLLGLYLGDGCLGATALMISLDARYPGIIATAQTAIEATVPGITVHRYQREGNAMVVVASTPLWRTAFPQHGAGRNHLRPIELTEWQLELTHRFPRELLRGLIHSDGCRTINRFKTRLPSGRVAPYEYPRYFFSNLPRTSGGSSASTASCWEFAGRSRTPGTSRSRIASRSRCSMSSSGRSGDRYTDQL